MTDQEAIDRIRAMKEFAELCQRGTQPAPFSQADAEALQKALTALVILKEEKAMEASDG